MSNRHVLKPIGRSILIAVFAASLGAAALVYYLTEPPPYAAAPRAVAPSANGAPPPSSVITHTPPVETGGVQVLPVGADGVVQVPELRNLAARLNQPDASIEQDLEIIDALLEGFRRWNQGANPPGGENEEIVAQLSGHNARHLAVLPPDLPAVNDKGQLLDRWGTPFFFHPLSRDVLEVRSAGPDKRLFTSDDHSSGM